MIDADFDRWLAERAERLAVARAEAARMRLVRFVPQRCGLTAAGGAIALARCES